MIVPCRVRSCVPAAAALVRVTLEGEHPRAGPFQHTGLVSAALADALLRSRVLELDVDGKALAATGQIAWPHLQVPPPPQTNHGHD